MTVSVSNAWRKNLLKVWDLAERRPRTVFEGFETSVSSVCFSPDGRFVAAAPLNSNRIGMWDVLGRSNVWFRETSNPAVAILFLPTGDGLISGGGADAGNALLWDLQGNATPFPPEHKGWIYKMSLSPRGELMATASADGTTIIWNRAARKPLLKLPGFGAGAFSPDNQFFALVDGQAISLWRLWSGEKIGCFRGHLDSIEAVEFSPDGESLLSGGSDATLKIWNLKPRPIADTLIGHTNWINRIAFSPDGQRFASLNYHQPFYTCLWDVRSRQRITNLLGPTAPALALSFSPNGRMLACGSSDHTIHVWDPESGVPLMKLTNDFDAGALSFSWDSRTLAVSLASFVGGGKRLSFWDIPSRTRFQKLEPFSTNATAVTFAHKRDLLAVGYFDGTVRVWDFSRERLLHEFKRHNAQIWPLEFNSDDRLLASGGFDDSAIVYDLRTGESFGPLVHSGLVWSVAFSHDGRSLATGASDSKVRIWSLINLKTTLVLKGHAGPVTGVDFAPDDFILGSSGADGVVRFWVAPPILSTILELAGANLDKVLPTNFTFDSRSLIPFINDESNVARSWVYTEEFPDPAVAPGQSGRAIRDDSLKIIRWANGTQATYDLTQDPTELKNLGQNLTTEQSVRYSALTNHLAELQNFPHVTEVSYLSNRFSLKVDYVQGIQFSLRRSDTIASNSWKNVSATQVRTNYSVILTDLKATNRAAYYQVATPAP